MIAYPQKHQRLFNLIINSLKAYPAAFIAMLPISLALGAVTTLCLYFSDIPGSGWIKIVAFIVMALVQVYLFCSALRLMHEKFSGNPVTLKSAYESTFQRISAIYAGFFLSLIVCCVVGSVGYLISSTLSALVPGDAQLITALFFVFISLPMLLISVWLVMVVPQLAVLYKTVGQALVDSFKWIGYRNWLPTFILYVIALLLLVAGFPTAKHMVYLRAHYLALPFNLVLYVIVLPFVVNYTLLLLKRIEV